jgi:hypothetical protein
MEMREALQRRGKKEKYGRCEEERRGEERKVNTICEWKVKESEGGICKIRYDGKGDEGQEQRSGNTKLESELEC